MNDKIFEVIADSFIGFDVPKREGRIILAKELYTLISNDVLDRVIEIILAEPENIQSSQSYRQGYARCSRDIEQRILNLSK